MRAGKYGRNIICPLCNEISLIYHFNWNALQCEHCKKFVLKYDWLTNSTIIQSNSDLLILVGNNMRELRKEKGYSQASFAAHVAIDRSYVGAMERGERNISVLNIIKIAKGLEVDMNALFKGIE